MRAPPNFLLALLTLSISGAYAADAEKLRVEGLRDSRGQPVLDSFGGCWGTGFTRPDAAACASLRQSEPATPAVASGRSAAQQGSGEATQGAAAVAPESSGSSAAQAAPAPISANGNPAYATDSNGFVVRSSQGECWRTGSWTPAQATVVGCDGVLAKALPVPAPAPSPKPAAPPEAPPSAQATTESRAAVPAPVTPEAAAPPAIVAPSEAPSAAANAAPGGKEPPVVVPSSPPAPATAELAPEGSEAGKPASETQPKSEKITLETDTYFDFDKATLKPEGKRKLQELAQRLSSMNLEVVVATGHTDWTGTDAYNQKLSERRASTVKHFLAAQGLPEKRIFTEGKGEKQPVADNRTREGRAQNRRVEVELVGTRNR